MVKRAFKSELLLSMIEDVAKFMKSCYSLDTINKETADKMKGNITEVFEFLKVDTCPSVRVLAQLHQAIALVFEVVRNDVTSANPRLDKAALF